MPNVNFIDGAGEAGAHGIRDLASELRFSIITPSYRSSQWLRLCIASVADQQDVQCEHIVQDACSDDGTQEWLPRDSRVKAFIEPDQGMYDAINRGFERATGEILAYLNCDEQYLPGALKQVHDYFGAHPQVDAVVSDTVVTDRQGNYICHRYSLVPRRNQIWVRFPVLSCALFVRRRVIKDMGIRFDTQWRDLGDFFSFSIGEAMLDLDAAPYGGARFPVEALLDDRTFVRFHLDVGTGDVVLAPFDMTHAHDWLEFAGIPGAEFPTISREQHFAEKIHSYTLPRETPNSRARDLIDMLLLIGSGKMDCAKVRLALDATFKRRKTHPLPADLSRPPAAWKAPFGALAGMCGLADDLDAAFETLNLFYSGLAV